MVNITLYDMSMEIPYYIEKYGYEYNYKGIVMFDEHDTLNKVKKYNDTFKHMKHTLKKYTIGKEQNKRIPFWVLYERRI